MIQQKTANIINHIALVLDASGSMANLKNSVIRMADEQIRNFAKESQARDQETRVSVYTFDYSNNIQCLVFDKDVLRLPSIASLYYIGGATALRDAIGKSIEDLKRTATMYGDHSFLLYVITDGAENDSKLWTEGALTTQIGSLPDNWTLGSFVPDAYGQRYLQRLGFPSGNVVTWEATEAGLRDVGTKMAASTSSYMVGRASGQRSRTNLFTVDAVGLTPSVVKAAGAVILTPGQFRLLAVKDDGRIDEFVEVKLRRKYHLGEAYYQLTKPETVQANKKIALYHRGKHTVYTGDATRDILGLRNYDDKVKPGSHSDFDIFVQSTSVNRRLIGGTNLLVLS